MATFPLTKTICWVSCASELCTFTKKVGEVYSSAFLVGSGKHVLNLPRRPAHYPQHILPGGKLGHADGSIAIQQILTGNGGSVVGRDAAHLNFNGSMRGHGIRGLRERKSSCSQDETHNGIQILFHGTIT